MANSFVFTRVRIVQVLTVLVVLLNLLPTQPARAHGGFVIESGEIDQYSWAVSIFPYPVSPGATVTSILIYDKVAGRSAIDLKGEVYMADPDSSEPCCKPDVHRGPYPLIADHTLYPGDYTAFLPIDKAGKWQIQFVMESPTSKYGFVASIDVQAPLQEGVIDVQALETQVRTASEAAAASAAQNAAKASAQPNSPLAAGDVAAGTIPVSPLSDPNATLTAIAAMAPQATTVPIDTQPANSPAGNSNLLLFGGLALVVVIGVVVTMMFGGKKA